MGPLDGHYYKYDLCWIVKRIKELQDQIIANDGDIQKLQEELKYFQNYFDNLDVQTEINNKLDEMAQNGELLNIFSSNIFNITTPQLYGALANGTADDIEAIANAIDAIYQLGGGIVWFPAGTYSISKSIKVPSNVWLMGIGVNSKIYMPNTTDNQLGVCISIEGDNTRIDNLFITFEGWNTPNVTTSQFSCIGIGNGTYIKTEDYPSGFENRNNCIINNIYSDKLYLVNSECHNSYTIENVVYENCLAENAMISFQPGSSVIKNLKIRNCTFAYLRGGTGGTGELIGFVVDGCNFIGSRFTFPFTMTNCTIADRESDNVWYMNNLALTGITLQNCNGYISNVDIDKTLPNSSYGIYLRNSYIYGENIDINSVANSINDELQSGLNVLNKFTANQPFNATGIGEMIDATLSNANVAFYYDTARRIYPTINFSQIGSLPTSVYLKNKRVDLNLGIGNITEFNSETPLVQLPANVRPSRTIYLMGFSRNGTASNSESNLIIFMIDTDGNIYPMSNPMNYEVGYLTASYEI